MDGFALHWSDTRGATRERPVELQICGEIQAGGDFTGVRLEKRSAVRIMTGAPIPDGADAVIPVEFILEDASRGTISVFQELQQVFQRNGRKVLQKQPHLFLELPEADGGPHSVRIFRMVVGDDDLT
mgnify:CR=1 FL=1